MVEISYLRLPVNCLPLHGCDTPKKEYFGKKSISLPTINPRYLADGRHHPSRWPDDTSAYPNITTTEFYFYLTTVSYYYFYLTTVLYGQIAKNGTLPEKSWDMRYDQVVPRTKQEHRVEGNRD